LQESIPVPPKDYFRVLGLEPGASGKQVKTAYRRLALKYHPDRNNSPGSRERFQEINDAYNHLLDHPAVDIPEASSYEEQMAREVYRREKERMYRRARARQEKKRRENEIFERPEWHDPLLVLRYGLHGFALLFAMASISIPIVLVILIGPVVLAGTFFFLVVGVFLLVYIYQRRRTWFRLGGFKYTWQDVRAFLRMEPAGQVSGKCYYSPGRNADGISYRVELLRIEDIRIRNFGPLNHEAGYTSRVKRVVIPRSNRARKLHRLASTIKVVTILICMIFFPVDSLLWRFVAGIFAGGAFSAVLLAIAGVRSKVSYLLTPALLIKAGVWILSLYLVSVIGPGFNITVTGSVYILVAGLFFLLDMIFDLVMGMFPFYPRLFRPVIPQGAVMQSLYRQGYQNYQELPFWSVFYPLIRWLF